MNERRAREVTWLEAFETRAAGERRAGATRTARWADRVALEAVGAANAPADAFVAERARHALQRLAPREPALARWLERSRLARRAGSACVALIAFALGLLADAIGSGQRINLLAPPLWGVLVVERGRLPVLLGRLAARPRLLRRAPRARRGAARARDARRCCARAGACRAPRAGGSATARCARFAPLWLARSAPLAALRAETVLHAGAAALALGLVAGLYARGLVLDYRVGWESTFLDAGGRARARRDACSRRRRSCPESRCPTRPAFAALRAAHGDDGRRCAGGAVDPPDRADACCCVVVLPRTLLALACAAWRAARSRRFRAAARRAVLPAPAARAQRGGAGARRRPSLRQHADAAGDARPARAARRRVRAAARVRVRADGRVRRRGRDAARAPIRALHAALALFDLGATPGAREPGPLRPRRSTPRCRAAPCSPRWSTQRRSCAASPRFGAPVAERRDAWRDWGDDARRRRPAVRRSRSAPTPQRPLPVSQHGVRRGPPARRRHERANVASAATRDSVSLSLVSHTNAGKTTLARTLLGRDIGEVRDAPHVTEFAEAHTMLETTRRRAAACCGTRRASATACGWCKRLRQAPSGRSAGSSSEVWDRWRDRPFWASQQALRNVRDEADVMLYLVNASADAGSGRLRRARDGAARLDRQAGDRAAEPARCTARKRRREGLLQSATCDRSRTTHPFARWPARGVRGPRGALPSVRYARFPSPCAGPRRSRSRRPRVGVFFVISGFLISRILFEELAVTGGVALARFYFRRTLRIFPPYYAFLASLAVLTLVGLVQLPSGTCSPPPPTPQTISPRAPGRSRTRGHSRWRSTSISCGPRSSRVWDDGAGLVLAAAFVAAAPALRGAYGLLAPSFEIPVRTETIADAVAMGCLLAGARAHLHAFAWYRRVLASRAVLALPLVIAACNELKRVATPRLRRGVHRGQPRYRAGDRSRGDAPPRPRRTRAEFAAHGRHRGDELFDLSVAGALPRSLLCAIGPRIPPESRRHAHRGARVLCRHRAAIAHSAKVAGATAVHAGGGVDAAHGRPWVDASRRLSTRVSASTVEPASGLVHGLPPAGTTPDNARPQPG